LWDEAHGRLTDYKSLKGLRRGKRQENG
jgi:hypothetical protein